MADTSMSPARSDRVAASLSICRWSEAGLLAPPLEHAVIDAGTRLSQVSLPLVWRHPTWGRFRLSLTVLGRVGRSRAFTLLRHGRFLGQPLQPFRFAGRNDHRALPTILSPGILKCSRILRFNRLCLYQALNQEHRNRELCGTHTFAR